MLLRTLLLLLCVSSGLCATLGLFQMQAEEKENLAVLDNAVEVNMQDTEETTDDLPKDPASHVEEGLLEKLVGNNNQPEADKGTDEEVEAAVSAPAEEVVDSDNKTEDIEAPANDQPSQDIPTEETKVDEAPVDDQPLQDIPTEETKAIEAPDNDKPSRDIPTEETKAVEAPVDDQPSQEDNEIRPVQTEEVPKKPEESHSRWSINSIRSSFQNMHGYFDSLVELVGGRNGVCEYRCRYGELPVPRPEYQLPEPNGCSSSLVGFQVNAALDLGIPAMTQCCNQLDSCYDTCGSSKYDCDSSFRSCLHDICSDLKKSLGLGTQVQTCESMADGLFNTVWTLGCRPYMNSQRAACICQEEEKDEL